MKNDLFGFDPYEALVNMESRLEYLENQVAVAHALIEKQHHAILRQHRQLMDLQTVTLHHNKVIKEPGHG